MVLVALVAFALCPARAIAQTDGGEEEAPAQAGASAPAPGSVAIGVEAFGVGDVIRPGELAGIRLALTDSAAMPRVVAVRLHMRDEDGDEMLVERRVTLNPNRALGLWLYARMPWRVTTSSLFVVSVHELSDPESGTGGVVRQLAATRIKPVRVLDPDADVIGVIGAKHLGLLQLEGRATGSAASASGSVRLATSHHAIDVVLGLVPQAMPDSWMGLATYGVLVWGDPAPSTLGSDQRARAILEWVRRGGHLVVMMPSVGSEWFSSSNPVREIMPTVEVRTVNDGSLEPYRALLTSRTFETEPLPEKVTIHTFTIPPHTEAGDASALAAGPHGTVIVRRLVGAGMVTVIGLPIDIPQLTSGEMLRADAFWHRVLGFRFDTLTTAQQNAQQIRLSVSSMVRNLSQFVGREITQRSAASAGLLLAMVLFIAYWIVAGPAGHWVAGKFGWGHQSWVLFMGSIVVFSIAAWVGSSLSRPTKVRAHHLTFLDHVHGQSTQRTTTWASILLPAYGEETIRLDEPGVNDQWKQAIAVWSDPVDGQELTFPDARSYVYDLRTPETITVPTRGTIKQFRFDWIGGKRWSTPIAIGPGWEPAITPNGLIRGRLTHDLPGPLEDVVIFFQPGQTSEGDPASQGGMRVLGKTMRIDVPVWPPGEVLDLEQQVTRANAKEGNDLVSRFDPPLDTSFTSRFNMPQNSEYTEAEAEADYLRLSLYSMLTPPDYTSDPTGLNSKPVMRRSEGQSLDMGKWFTQPALIIIGTVKHVKGEDETVGAPSPTPMMIRSGSGYREIPSEGRTIVRWVYPLAGAPAMFDGSTTKISVP